MKHNKKPEELINDTDQFLEAYADRYVSVIKHIAEAKVVESTLPSGVNDNIKSSSMDNAKEEIVAWAKSVGTEAGEWAAEKINTPTGQKILAGLMHADRLGNSIQGWVADPVFWSMDYAKQGWNHEKNFDFEDAWRGDKPLQGDAPDGQSVSWGDRKGFADHASYVASVPFNMILDPINLAFFGAGKALVGAGKVAKQATKTKAGQAVASTAKKATPVVAGVGIGAEAGKKLTATESISETHARDGIPASDSKLLKPETPPSSNDPQWNYLLDKPIKAGDSKWDYLYRTEREEMFKNWMIEKGWWDNDDNADNDNDDNDDNHQTLSEDSDSDVERVVTIITDAVENRYELFDFARILQADGFQAEANTSPVGHVRVQVDGPDILIYSSKYLEDGEDATIVGRYAIGREG